MRKLRLSVAIAFLMSLLSVAGALAYSITAATYSGAIRITNNGTATVNQASLFTLNTTTLINAGFVNSALTNTAIIYNGQSVPFMPGASGNFPWNVWVSSINALTNLDYTLYTGGNQTMNSTIAYFPGAGGMTVTDNASLELGNNFSLSQTVYIDTSKNGTLWDKIGAYTVNNTGSTINASFNISTSVVSLSGNTSSSLQNITINTTTVGTGLSYPIVESFTGGNNTANTTHNISMPSGLTSGDMILVIFTVKTATTITFPSGWGTLAQNQSTDTQPQVGIYYKLYTSEGANITASTSANVGSAYISYRISGSGQALAVSAVARTTNSAVADSPNLTTTWGTVPTLWFATSGIYTGLAHGVSNVPSGYTGTGYNGSDGTFSVVAAYISSNASSINPSAWSVAPNCNYVAHTVGIALVASNISLYIDSVLKQTASIGGNSIVDNANNITMVQGNSMAYMTSSAISVNGTTRGNWTWQYIPVGGTIQFTDNSGYGNTAIPTFRTAGSSPNVTANMTSYSPITQSTADPTNPDVTASNITAAFVSPPGLYTELNISAPGANLTNTLLDGFGIPRAIFWFPMLFGLIGIAGFVTYWLTRSLLIQGVVMAFIIILFSLMGGFGYWVCIEFIIMALAIIVGSKQYGF